MKQVMNKIKELLEGDEFKRYLDKYSEESRVEFTKPKVEFGVVDPSRYGSVKTLCVLSPENLEEDDSEIKDRNDVCGMNICFLHQNCKYSDLLEKEFGYCACLRDFIYDVFGKHFCNTRIGKTEFYNNAGATDFAATASETYLEIIRSSPNLVNDDDPFDDADVD